MKGLEDALDKANDQLSRKIEESDRLRLDIKSQGEQLITFQSRIRETQESLLECQSQLLPVQYEVAKSQREQEGLAKKVSWLEEELESKSKELFDMRRQLSSTTQDLEFKITQTEIEKNGTMEQLKSSKVYIKYFVSFLRTIIIIYIYSL